MTHFNRNHLSVSRRIVSGRDVFREFEDKLRDLLRRFFMGEMPQARNGVNARIRQSRREFTGALRRHGFIIVRDDQVDRQAQARQVSVKRPQIPMRHHPQRAGDMRGISHQPFVKEGSARVDPRSGAIEQTSYGGGIDAPGEIAWRQGIQEQAFRETRQQMAGDALEWRQGAIERNQSFRRDDVIESQPGGNGRAGRMSDDDLWRKGQGLEQRCDGAGHAGQRLRVGVGRGGEPMSRQVWRHDSEALGEKRRDISPGVCRRAGPVEQKQDWSFAENLNMPVDAARREPATRDAVRPVGAVLFEGERTQGREHDARDYRAVAAARTASDKRVASTKGKRR